MDQMTGGSGEVEVEGTGVELMIDGVRERL